MYNMIKDVIQNEGRVSLKALITKADLGRTNKNAPYFNMILEDSSGQLDAKFWNITAEQTNEYFPGQVVRAVGDLIYYRNAPQLRIHTLEVLPFEDVSDYVRQAPRDRADMEKEVDALVASFKNPVLRDLTSEAINMYRKEYFRFPAAVRNHHNYVGGLAYHSLSMAEMGKAMVRQYPFLNEDLLIAGILLHDMGKVLELSSPVLPEYTPQGNLLGHISIMNTLIDRVAVALDLQDAEETMLLKHMILSHHGKMEYGSPVLPMIPEAEILTMLDNIDARMVMMKQQLDGTVPGTFGPRVFALDNRMLYRSTLYQGEEYEDEDGDED